MATIYVNSNATGTPDGLTAATGWLHPDNITGSRSAGQIIEFVAGSGPYYQAAAHALGGNGAAGNPVIWRGNGCEWTCGLSLNAVSSVLNSFAYIKSDAGRWNLSAGGTNEYYFTKADGSSPVLVSPESSAVDGHHYELTAEDASYQRGTVGSLTNGQLGYGNNDTLGFNTVYCRFDDGYPASHEVVVAQFTSICYTTWTHHRFEDFIFTHFNAYAIRNNSTTKWEVDRCVIRYCDDGAVSAENATAGSEIQITNSIGYFAGHRLISAVGTNSLITAYNNLAVKTHLFALETNANTQSHVFKNNIGYKLCSGWMDCADAGSGTITEDYNWIHCDFSGGATSLDYTAGASPKWTTTGAHSLPPSLDTNTSTEAAMIAAMPVGTDFLPVFNIDLTDLDSVTNEQLRSLTVANTSTMLGLGIAYWTTGNPEGINGEPFSNFDTDLGPNQSTFGPFHPRNL